MTRPSLVARLAGVALAVAALAPAVAARAQQNFDTIQVRAIRVADGVHMLTGAGGNIALLSGPDGTILVDDQYAPLTPKILAAVKGVTPVPVKFLVNTHFHFDHTGGNENIAREGVVIVAHDNVRERMTKEKFYARFNRRDPPAPKGALPVVTFLDQVEFHLNGETIMAFHVANAHTDGDVMVKLLNADVVHTGDVFVRYGFPFVDSESGGSVLGMIPAIEKLLAITGPRTQYIPGHGAVATRTDVEAYLTMLRAIRDRTMAAIRQKRKLDDFVATRPLADYEAKFGASGFIKPAEILAQAWGELEAPKRK
ncbi:MAG: MBL fold metallo-hydrolase [Gemmatimonadetes bacterium]|nr:MBL fold metallo-hydrolase [Gemmatimonadota bacterium]